MAAASSTKTVEMEVEAGCCGGGSTSADIEPYKRELAKVRAEKAALEAKLKALQPTAAGGKPAAPAPAAAKPAPEAAAKGAAAGQTAVAAPPTPTSNSVPAPEATPAAPAEGGAAPAAAKQPTARKLWIAQADEAIAAAASSNATAGAAAGGSSSSGSSEEPAAVDVASGETSATPAHPAAEGGSSESGDAAPSSAGPVAGTPSAPTVPRTPASSVARPQLDSSAGVLAVLSPEKWVPDAVVTVCQSCKREFSLVSRKHHCRLCGGIYCSLCSSKSLLLPNPVVSPSPTRPVSAAAAADSLSSGSSRNVLAAGAMASQRVCDECFTKAGVVRLSQRPSRYTMKTLLSPSAEEGASEAPATEASADAAASSTESRGSEEAVVVVVSAEEVAGGAKSAAATEA